jgi:hypothetical protein
MPRTPTIRIEERKIDEIELIEPILNAFVQKINRSLLVSCPHGHIREPYDGREYDLSIFFWSRPFEGEYSESHLSRAYGFSLKEDQRDCFQVDKDFPYPGTIIYDRTGGSEVALIVEKTLYILFDLPHYGGTSPDKILELILADYYLYLTYKEGFEKEIQSRLSKLPHERFLELYRSALEGTHEDEIEEFEDRISQLRTKLTLAVRDRRIALEKKSDTSAHDETVSDEKIERIYERLCKLSVTGKITVSEDMMVVPVGQIDIEFEGVVYDIGEFEIKIDLKNGGVLCVNKSREVNGSYHPHVDESGDCCLGDASYGIGVLLGELELETVVLMMIEFLKSYNPEGAYHGAEIEEWPLKECEE